MRLFRRSKRNVLAPDSEFMPRYLFGNTNGDDDDDSASIMTHSTMATTGSNRGAGWTVDRYFLQPAGRWIESWASRLGLRFGVIPPSIIARRLQDLLHPTFKRTTIHFLYRMRTLFLEWEFAESNRVTIDSGIDCLVKQMQYVVIEYHLLYVSDIAQISFAVSKSSSVRCTDSVPIVQRQHAKAHIRSTCKTL